MSGLRASGRSRRARGDVGAIPVSSFQLLHRLTRRVQWLNVGLLVAVAFLPATVYVVFEVDHVRTHARHEAQQLAYLVASHIEKSGLDLAAISARLRRGREEKDLLYVRLTGPGGSGSVEFGEPGRTFFPTRVTVPFEPAPGPFGEITVEADDRPLIRQAAKILGTFVLVAVLLALVVYRVPMRALRLAIAELEATHAQLIHADKLSSIGEMYAGLAHEINNPLGIILSRVHILLGGARARGLNPELVRDLEMIDRHGSRIAEVIRSLLAFARKGSFDAAETDLNRVIADVVALVEKPLAKQGIRVESLLDPALPAVRASPEHLQQVFLNFVNNARDAMPGGGTITLRTARDGRRLMAEVRDTGTGIASDVRERIFEPFFTTKDVGKGTGLGLSVSYGIVKAHGGDIEVESAPGSGALFRVTLPIGGGRR